jgi:hypothetical protein
MKHWDKEKLISLLKASEEGRIELEDTMREIARAGSRAGQVFQTSISNA